MKNVKKNIIIFGAVVIALLMVSSATAVTMPQSNESSKSGTDVTGDINYVEPGISLSGSEQRTILSDALLFIDDPDVRILVQEIIKKMDSKGFVDDSDVEQIISSNTLALSAAILCSIQTGGNCGGSANCIRRPFGLPHVFSFWIPILLLNWNVCFEQVGSTNPCYPNIYIGGNHITYDCSGHAIGFVGGYVHGMPVGLTLGGWALVVTYPSSNNQQSSPQITPNSQIQNSLQGNSYANQQTSQTLQGAQQSSPTNR